MTSHIGTWRITGVIHESDSALLYKAHGEDGSDAVVKQLRPNVAVDAEQRSQFLAIATALCGVQHDNLAQIYEVLPAHNAFARAYHDGRSLNARWHFDRPMTPELVVALIARICRGVHKLHELGWLHGDLSPANILLTQTGGLKVIDVGVAARIASNMALDLRPRGTWAYMSPEQVQGLQRHASSDVFAIGTLMWELLMGRRLFLRSNAAATMSAVVKEPASDVPAPWQPIVARALAKDPHRRFASCDALLESLEEIAAGHGFRNNANALVELIQ